MKTSKAQLKRDKQAILKVLSRGPKTFAQISLQAGEQLWPAVRELVAEGKVIDISGDVATFSLAGPTTSGG